VQLSEKAEWISDKTVVTYLSARETAICAARVLRAALNRPLPQSIQCVQCGSEHIEIRVKTPSVLKRAASFAGGAVVGSLVAAVLGVGGLPGQALTFAEAENMRKMLAKGGTTYACLDCYMTWGTKIDGEVG
jgi:hypothetical protein